MPIDAVTVAVAPAASVPAVADKVTHDCAFDAVQFIGAVPAFVSVYDWVDGVNGPPAVPDEVRPPAGVTVSGPATVAAFTVNVSPAEVPPPGVGLNTVTCAVPADATSAADIDAVSCVAEPNVVVRFAPFHRTTEPATKFVPVTVSVNAAEPAVAEVGVMDDNVGAGLLAATVMGMVVVALCSPWTEPESLVFPNQAAA